MEENREENKKSIGYSEEKHEEREAEWMDRKTRRKILIVLPLLVAVFSIFVMAKFATSVSFYKNTIAALDRKKETVLQLTAVSTGASAAITLLPGDVATPIADKLADLSSYFIIVLCAIYLEKYLLTITGFAAFVILIPISCVMFSLHALCRKPGLLQVAKKLFLFGIVIVVAIPSSVGVSNMIEKTYSESIDLTMQEALQTTESVKEEIEKAESLAETGSETESADIDEAGQGDTAGDRADKDEQNWLQNFFTNASETVTSTVQSALDGAVGGVEEKINEFKNMLNRMIEALAVMIVTSCLIPIIVLLFFVWLVKLILNLDIPMPPMVPRGRKGYRPL